LVLAAQGFSGCSGDGNANMAPVEGEPADDPEIAAIKNSGKSPQEIRRLVLEKLKAKQTARPANPRGKKGQP